jgi:hypothetical protein
LEQLVWAFTRQSAFALPHVNSQLRTGTRAIYDALLDTGRLRRRIAYTTIKTYLDRLVQKGYIDGQLLGDGRGTYRYTAVVSRAEMCDHPDLLARLVRVFRLTPAEFTRWCYAHGQLSQ